MAGTEVAISHRIAKRGPARFVDDESNIQLLAEEITRYLRAHPNAADTMEGVIRWWLRDVGRSESMQHLQAALNVLIERGDVAVREVAGGTRLYAAGPRISGHD